MCVQLARRIADGEDESTTSGATAGGGTVACATSVGSGAASSATSQRPRLTLERDSDGTATSAGQVQERLRISAWTPRHERVRARTSECGGDAEVRFSFPMVSFLPKMGQFIWGPDGGIIDYFSKYLSYQKKKFINFPWPPGKKLRKRPKSNKSPTFFLLQSNHDVFTFVRLLLLPPPHRGPL